MAFSMSKRFCSGLESSSGTERRRLFTDRTRAWTAMRPEFTE
jgi:hypothetical protein